MSQPTQRKWRITVLISGSGKLPLPPRRLAHPHTALTLARDTVHRLKPASNPRRNPAASLRPALPLPLHRHRRLLLPHRRLWTHSSTHIRSLSDASRVFPLAQMEEAAWQ